MMGHLGPQCYSIYHDKEYVPDKEPGSSGCPAGCGDGSVFILRILVYSRSNSLPGFHVTMQTPFLLVNERLERKNVCGGIRTDTAVRQNDHVCDVAL